MYQKIIGILYNVTFYAICILIVVWINNPEFEGSKWLLFSFCALNFFSARYKSTLINELENKLKESQNNEKLLKKELKEKYPVQNLESPNTDNKQIVLEIDHLRNENNALYSKIGLQNSRIKKLEELTHSLAELYPKEQEKRKYLIMEYYFAAVDWDKRWPANTHHDKIQRIRFNNAINDNIYISEMTSEESAVIIGTKGDPYPVIVNGCDCYDWKKRKKPCKHMYYLAMQLYNRQLTKGSET